MTQQVVVGGEKKAGAGCGCLVMLIVIGWLVYVCGNPTPDPNKRLPRSTDNPPPAETTPPPSEPPVAPSVESEPEPAKETVVEPAPEPQQSVESEPAVPARRTRSNRRWAGSGFARLIVLVPIACGC
jgi:hypothetical protein